MIFSAASIAGSLGRKTSSPSDEVVQQPHHDDFGAGEMTWLHCALRARSIGLIKIVTNRPSTTRMRRDEMR